MEAEGCYDGGGGGVKAVILVNRGEKDPGFW
jgi:hypothetical protein